MRGPVSRYQLLEKSEYLAFNFMNDNMVFLKFALEIIRENAILKY
jgi:hypothetical protein